MGFRDGAALMARLQTLPPRIDSLDTAIARTPKKVADAELLTPEHRAWRLAVMQRAGWRCEVVDSGYRCTNRHPMRMFADHVVERKDGGALTDIANGMCVCPSHHQKKTLRARAERFARKT